MRTTALVVPCERCEDLKIQSHTNHKVLNDCATDFKIKQTEVEAVRDLVKKLQAQLDQANVEIQLEKARFARELALKDQQLTEQAIQSKLHIDTSNELPAQLTKQHKEITGAHALGTPQVVAQVADY